MRDLQSGTQGAVRAAVAGQSGRGSDGGRSGGAGGDGAALGPVGRGGGAGRAGGCGAAGVVAWTSWRLLGWTLAAVAGLVLLGWLASTAVLWWDTGAIGAARVEKRQLQLEVAEMQANRDEWAKAGFLAKLTRCKPRQPAVRAGGRARRRVRDRERLPGAAGVLRAAGTGRAGLSGLPSGNQSVRLGVSGPEFPDRMGMAGLGSFGGRVLCAGLGQVYRLLLVASRPWLGYLPQSLVIGSLTILAYSGQCVLLDQLIPPRQHLSHSRPKGVGVSHLQRQAIHDREPRKETSLHIAFRLPRALLLGTKQEWPLAAATPIRWPDRKLCQHDRTL